MTLMPTGRGFGLGGYDDPNLPPEVQDISKQRQFAELLRSQGSAPLEGQMVSGHYVAPSFTQSLAKILQGYGAGQLDTDVAQKTKDYQANKAAAFASILKGNQPVTNTTTPAYTPEQQDRFGSPLPDVQRDSVTTTETPAQVNARLQPQVLEYMSKYGNTPEAQYLIGRMDKQDDRAYNDTREEKIYTRNRGDQLEDRSANWSHEDLIRGQTRQWQVDDKNADHEFQRIMEKERQGFQTDQQEKQFAQQYRLQNQSQTFQAGQNKLGRDATLASRPLVQVMGNDGKPTYVQQQNAVGKQPYTAKQEAADVLKVQQKAQNEISAQQVLDQADALFKHKGRAMGTGSSSWTGSVPFIASDAKDFQKNLETFKAQTFVPMVSALKGMGALSDAEGRKLTDSVGALDPNMSEKAFADSLKQITKTLYAKAKANGLNVSLPSFADDRAPTPGVPSQDAIDAEIARRAGKK